MKYLILSTALFIVSIAEAQKDKKDLTLTFPYPEITNPSDPDPTTQTVKERTESLRKRIKEVIALIDSSDLNKVTYEYISPYWIARVAAEGKKPVNEVTALFSKVSENKLKKSKKELEKSLELEPLFLLNGRAASFLGEISSHGMSFWAYIDGKWRILPES